MTLPDFSQCSGRPTRPDAYMSCLVFTPCPMMPIQTRCLTHFFRGWGGQQCDLGWCAMFRCDRDHRPCTMYPSIDSASRRPRLCTLASSSCELRWFPRTGNTSHRHAQNYIGGATASCNAALGKGISASADTVEKIRGSPSKIYIRDLAF